MQYRCKYIADNIEGPWSHPQLRRIFNCENCNELHALDSDDQTNPGEKNIASKFGQMSYTIFQLKLTHCVLFSTDMDEIEFFNTERGCMIEIRAQKLVESKLFELAIKLTRHALRAIRACMHSHSLHANLAALQHHCIMEIYYALMFKYQLRQQLESELMALDLITANNFIHSTIATINDTIDISMKNQSNPKQPDRKRPWLNRIKKPYTYMGHFALQFVIRRILNEEQPELDSSQVLKNLLYLWINEHRNDTAFESLFRELVQTQFQSRIYDCCEYFYEKVNIIGSCTKLR